MTKRKSQLRNQTDHGAHEYRQNILVKLDNANNEMVCVLARATDAIPLSCLKTIWHTSTGSVGRGMCMPGCDDVRSVIPTLEQVASGAYENAQVCASANVQHATVQNATEHHETACENCCSVKGVSLAAVVVAATRTPPAKKSAGPKGRQGEKK